MYDEEQDVLPETPKDEKVLLKRFLKCCTFGDGESMWALYELKGTEYINALKNL